MSSGEAQGQDKNGRPQLGIERTRDVATVELDYGQIAAAVGRLWTPHERRLKPEEEDS